MASPMSQLVQGRRVVAVGALELAFFRQGNAVGRRPIESTVAGRVSDLCPGRLQDLFGPLYSVPLLFCLGLDLLRRQAVDLFAVENGSEEHTRPFELDGFLHFLTVRIAHRPALVIQLVLLFVEFVVLNGRAFLGLAHLCAGVRRLLVGPPARIGAALGHQVNRVDALVPLAGGWVHRQVGVGFARLPRLLPRCGAGLELLDQLFGHDFMKRFFEFPCFIPAE